MDNNFNLQNTYKEYIKGENILNYGSRAIIFR